MTTPTIPLGFEVGSGAPVAIPLAHTFVSGQTQLSGKTTALRAIVERSGRRALAFITKRGETFEGRRVRPYLPREGASPIPWRLVEIMLASAVDQKSLKYERLWIINAAKGAYSLEDVLANVRRLRAKTKNDRSADVYTLLEEYLELVLPQMRSLGAADTLDLAPGLNVMDLSAIAGQTQAMVIRAALEQINHHETQVLTVLPEAWEFAPRDRAAPARGEAEAMARKGAAPKVQNFLLCDSQDIAGVSPVLRQASSVWLLGVQRELNELRRAVQMMPAGVKRPKADDVAALGLGQFFVCSGGRAIKTYVQPSWMARETAIAVARGQVDAALVRETIDRGRKLATRVKEDFVTKDEAEGLERENARLKADVAELRRRLEAFEKGSHDESGPRAAARVSPGHQAAGRPDRAQRADTDGSAQLRNRSAEPRDHASAGAARTFTAEDTFDNEALYQAIKARLIAEAPAVLQLLEVRPELEVTIERRVITADASTTIGRVGRLIRAEFLAESKRFREILLELERTGPRVNNKTLSNALAELVGAGFLTKESVDRYRAVPEMTVRVIEAA